MKKIILLLLFPVAIQAQTWNTYNVGSTELVRHVDFPSVDTGYVSLDYGDLRRTTNSALNWSLVNTPANTWDFDFLNSQYGFIVSDTSIYKTVDGGNTWTEVLHDNRIEFYRVSVVDANTVFASGKNLFTSADSLCLFKTTDGGSNWSIISIDASFFFESGICFQNAANGFYAAGFSIKSTTDGGATWAVPYTDPNWNNYFVDMDFPNTDTGYALGYDILFHSIDAGANWTATNIPGQIMYEQYFVNGLTGFICGGNGFNSGWVQQTNNGGNTWTPIYTSPYTYICLSFPTNTKAYFGGDNGTVLTYDASPSGISETENLSASVYPNPASRSAILSQTQTGGMVRLYALSGELVSEFATSENETKLNLENIAPGIYLIEIKNENKTAHGKLIVE